MPGFQSVGSPGFLSTGDVTLCQDPIGWKVPIRTPSQPSTPQPTQHPKANQQQTAGHPIKQLEVSQEPVANGQVDSPTATSNGPAVQPVSAKKKGADKSKGKPRQATDDAAGGDAKHEDPEKKAKKVRPVMPGGCVHIACAHLFLQAIISSNGRLLLMLEQYSFAVQMEQYSFAVRMEQHSFAVQTEQYSFAIQMEQYSFATQSAAVVLAMR